MKFVQASIHFYSFEISFIWIVSFKKFIFQKIMYFTVLIFYLFIKLISF